MPHKKKTILIVTMTLFVVLIGLGTFAALRVKSQIKDLFRMNKELQEESYYMGEFEFKMLGLAYWFDRGHYIKAISGISRLHEQLETREGLVKIPEFKDKKTEMEFYLNLQNPRTGAFMDDSYPYSTYTGPTGNVLEHLDVLAAELHQPLKLKYPLKYLEEINTPEKLDAYLNDVATVGWIAQKFPQTSFHNARDILSLFNEESVIEKHHLYNASPKWKKALLKWFYDDQDPGTGLWGPKSKNGKLVRKDTMNSASIIKAFVDENGNDLYNEFPLRYQDEFAKSILNEPFFERLPKDDELDQWHEWGLNTSKSIRTITRYLWKDVSQEEKTRTRRTIAHYTEIKFRKFYIPSEGAFSYYPNAKHATLDGTGSAIGDFADYGFFSARTQKRLWGSPEENIEDLGTYGVLKFFESDFLRIANYPEVNSVRLYYGTIDYNNLTSGVIALVYPKETVILDVMDFVPKTRRWVEATSQSMGNWVSRESTLQELESIKIKKVKICRRIFPLDEADEALQKKGELTVVGFDTLQIPKCRMTFVLK